MTSSLSDIGPTFLESTKQIVEGLRAFSILSHPFAMASMLAYALPRHGMTPASAVLGSALTWGNRVALVDRWGPMTYRQLGAASERLASSLSIQTPVGARVGLMASDDRSFVTGLAALGLCGAHVWLVNPRMGADDLAHCVRENRIGCLVCSPGCEDRLAGFGGRVISTQSFPGLIDSADPRSRPRHVRGSTFAMLTSGTTGAPASIPIRRRWTAPLPSLALAGATGVRHGESALICVPLFHGYGLACAMLCLAAGSTMVLSSACKAEGLSVLGKQTSTSRIDWGEAIFSVACREEVGTVFAVPAQLRSLACYLDSNPPRTPQEKVSHVVSGSDRLDLSTLQTLQRRWGPVVTNYYGTTESGTVTMISGPDLASRPMSVGRPVAGSRVRIVDRESRVVPRGASGLVQAASPLVFTGHGWRAWHTTSDLGRVDADGYLCLEGRVGSVRRTSGEFVDPSRVESVLAGVDGVESVRAFMVADEQHGGRVAVEIRGTPSLDVEGLRDLVRHRLGPHFVPVTIEILTSSG